ncbi:hypothetical protein [Beijerinckia sp. L45]|uniref:hypothetical protein n=1 Tax=Beijerinckia sp. L45 TaxID=1641855 RepID=UPI00131E9E4D|nr:hypothetical protein [Beijerinckia sp. L45]
MVQTIDMALMQRLKEPRLDGGEEVCAVYGHSCIYAGMDLASLNRLHCCEMKFVLGPLMMVDGLIEKEMYIFFFLFVFLSFVAGAGVEVGIGEGLAHVRDWITAIAPIVGLAFAYFAFIRAGRSLQYTGKQFAISHSSFLQAQATKMIEADYKFRKKTHNIVKAIEKIVDEDMDPSNFVFSEEIKKSARLVAELLFAVELDIKSINEDLYDPELYHDTERWTDEVHETSVEVVRLSRTLARWLAKPENEDTEQRDIRIGDFNLDLSGLGEKLLSVKIEISKAEVLLTKRAAAVIDEYQRNSLIIEKMT